MQLDDLIWAHDYHLLCLAEALREAGLRNRMGLFLHTPFPAPSVFMTDPAHAELIRAMCQFDLLGFQTEDDRGAFTDYVLRHADGSALDGGRLKAFDRTLRTGVYPIGVHVDEVRARGRGACQSASCVAAARQLARAAADPERRSAGLFQGAAASGLSRSSSSSSGFRSARATWCSCRSRRHRAATSRRIARSAASWKREAGRINGRFAEVDWMPLRYLNRGFARSALMPLYAEAQVGLVTPLRDGMNLVAKEYVAAQDPDDPGVLVLSQFAGAARELDAALIVNPYDEAGVAAALDRALAMGRDERRERHAAMMAVMRRNSLDAWRDRFEADLRA